MWARAVRGCVVGAAVLTLAACTSSDVAVVGGAPLQPVTPVATTEPARVPTGVPQPTAFVVPTAAPTATNVAEPTAVADPTATAVPVAAPTPAVAPAPTAASAPAAPAASTAILIANGGEVYTLNCARCHGENGLGSERYRGLLGVGSLYTTDGMIAELTNGHPVTFGFADKLSADEIASVVAYVKATFP